jgi:hypothetical protein
MPAIEASPQRRAVGALPRLSRPVALLGSRLLVPRGDGVLIRSEQSLRALRAAGAPIVAHEHDRLRSLRGRNRGEPAARGARVRLVRPSGSADPIPRRRGYRGSVLPGLEVTCRPQGNRSRAASSPECWLATQRMGSRSHSSLARGPPRRGRARRPRARGPRDRSSRPGYHRQRLRGAGRRTQAFRRCHHRASWCRAEYQPLWQWMSIVGVSSGRPTSSGGAPKQRRALSSVQSACLRLPTSGISNANRAEAYAPARACSCSRSALRWTLAPPRTAGNSSTNTTRSGDRRMPPAQRASISSARSLDAVA